MKGRRRKGKEEEGMKEGRGRKGDEGEGSFSPDVKN